MSDLSDPSQPSTPTTPSDPTAVPFDFEQTAGFRYSTLYLLRPERVETVRLFGRLLHDLILEGSPHMPDGQSFAHRELTAAHADLLHLRDFFGFIGLHLERDNDLTRAEVRLCYLAEQLCEDLTRMAGRLAEALK